jgi:LuxR family maltose regulon positive regulatory protein
LIHGLPGICSGLILQLIVSLIQAWFHHQPTWAFLILINHLAQVRSMPDHDDYHVIQNQGVHQAVSFLLEHRPVPFHLVIATRADPPLPLAKLRARCAMLELRQADLCFTWQEAADFLKYTMGLQISSEDAARITARTEVLIDGLQMAALSMQIDDISVLFLLGSHHMFAARKSWDDKALKFGLLLYTSVVDQLTAPVMRCSGGLDSSSTSSSIILKARQANLSSCPRPYSAVVIITCSLIT